MQFLFRILPNQRHESLKIYKNKYSSNKMWKGKQQQQKTKTIKI